MPVFLNSQNSDFEKDFKKLLSSKREDSLDVDLSVKAVSYTHLKLPTKRIV